MLSTIALASLLFASEKPLTAEEIARKLEPHFRPPEKLANDLGKYRSPLRFDDDKVVKTPADWKKRRAEILKYWHGAMGPWPEVIGKPKLEYLKKERDG